MLRFEKIKNFFLRRKWAIYKQSNNVGELDPMVGTSGMIKIMESYSYGQLYEIVNRLNTWPSGVDCYFIQ